MCPSRLPYIFVLKCRVKVKSYQKYKYSRKAQIPKESIHVVLLHNFPPLENITREKGQKTSLFSLKPCFQIKPCTHEGQTWILHTGPGSVKILCRKKSDLAKQLCSNDNCHHTGSRQHEVHYFFLHSFSREFAICRPPTRGFFNIRKLCRIKLAT